MNERACFIIFFCFQVVFVGAQITESKAVLLSDSGLMVSLDNWPSARQNIIALYKEHMFGEVPELNKPTFKVLENDKTALNGLAERIQVRAYFEDKHYLDILIYLPIRKTQPSGVFLGYNFFGNHTVITDSKVFLTNGWCSNDRRLGRRNNRASVGERGLYHDRWPVSYLIKNGFGVATAHYGDLEPDHGGGHLVGLRSVIKGDQDWSAMGLYAWGLSRIVDYLITLPQIDKNKIIALGHSRLGKAALWAAAQDERFAMHISNNSGCGGAALFKRKVGEDIARINQHFPHWFNSKFKNYNDREEKLPFDQHMLLALIAPRPLYVASASEDYNSDPEGEFLATGKCSEIYEVLGKRGLGFDQFPKLNETDHSGDVAYHLRQGKHEITYYDWQQYLAFAKNKLR